MKCVRVHTRCGESRLLKTWTVVLSICSRKEEGSWAGSEALEGGAGAGVHMKAGFRSACVSWGHSSSLQEEGEPPACTTAPPDLHSAPVWPTQQENNRDLIQDPTHKHRTAINVTALNSVSWGADWASAVQRGTLLARLKSQPSKDEKVKWLNNHYNLV